MNDANTAPTAATLEIVCDGLFIRRGDRNVLSDVSFTMRGDEAIALIGPNGAGKTTLLLAMLGLLRANRGGLLINGSPAHRVAAMQRGRWIAYVPQTVAAIPQFTVFDVVAGGRFPHVAPLHPLSAADEAAIGRSLRRCGMDHLAARPLHTLSAGERQKTMIAAAIAQDAALMLLDEPSTALDPAYQIELVQLLRDWSAAGRGFVVISHDLHLPSAIAHRVIALRAGRIAADGPANEILTPDRLAPIYGAEFESIATANGDRFVVPCWGR